MTDLNQPIPDPPAPRRPRAGSAPVPPRLGDRRAGFCRSRRHAGPIRDRRGRRQGNGRRIRLCGSARHRRARGALRPRRGRGTCDFEVVALDIDTARLDWRQGFLDQAGLSRSPSYADPSADVFEQLKRTGKVVRLPTSFLLDSQGCTLGTMAAAAQWNSPDGVNLLMAALGK